MTYDELTTQQRRAFLAADPTRLAIVAGVHFYEDPEHGDEAPLIAITPSGRVVRTFDWEAPEAEDVLDDEGLR